jgi:hypothetical protein
VNCEQEGQPCSTPLAATEKKLDIVSVSDGKVQRASHSPAKVRLNLNPFSERPQPPIELLEQWHDSVKLLRKYLIGHRLGARIYLPSRFESFPNGVGAPDTLGGCRA